MRSGMEAASSGLLNGLVVGQGMMRQYQQDQRQAGMDQRALVRDDQLQADRVEDRAYLNKQRGLADEDRTVATAEKAEKKRAEEANRLAGVFNQLNDNDALTERELQTLLRSAPGFVDFIDNDKSGKKFDQLVKDPATGKFAVNLQMPDGSFAPLGEKRQKGEDATLFALDDLKRLTRAALVSSGADAKLFEAKKAEALKIEEVGGKNGMKRKVIVNADGTTRPIGEEYPQFDPLRKSATDGSGGSSSDTQLMKNIKYFEDQGEDSDTAYILATQGVADRVGLASKLQASYLQSYDASLRDGPTREQLVEEANIAADNLIAKYFTKPKAKGKNAAVVLPPAAVGMALDPYIGPLRSRAPGGMAAPATVTQAQPQKKSGKFTILSVQ